MGTGHLPAATDKASQTLFDERRMPLVAAIIGSEPNASIVIYDSNIAGVIRYFTQIGWKPLVQQGEKARHPWTGSKMAVPIKIHTLWVLMELQLQDQLKNIRLIKLLSS